MGDKGYYYGYCGKKHTHDSHYWLSSSGTKLCEGWLAVTEPVSIKEDVHAYPPKWCQDPRLHVPHIIARKEEDQQLYHYYCAGTWE